MTVSEALILCPLCLAKLVMSSKDAQTDGSFYLRKHMYGGQDSVTGRDGWICEKNGTKVYPVAGRQYESPDA